MKTAFLPVRVLLFTVFAILTSCADDYQAKPLATNDVIVAFGDSLTFGVGASKEANYPAILDGLLTQKVVNSGVSGEQTTASLASIDAVLEKNQPALVILCIGGNDFLRKRAESEIKKNIQTLILKIRLSGAEVILLAVPEPSIFLSPSPIYEELAEDMKVILLEDTLTDLLSDNAYKSDAIHLNDQGYKLLAEAIAQTMRDSGFIL